MHTFFNDSFVSADQAFLHVSDLAIQRGYGIFDFLKVERGHAFFLNQYLDRFYRSAHYMRLEVPLQRNYLEEVVAELIQKNDQPHAGIKMILTGGYAIDGYKPERPNLIITQQPLMLPGQEIFENGIAVITHEHVRELPEVKSINYITGIWVEKKRIEAGAADVLYVKDDVISEFPRCNFFVVTDDGRIITPAKNILRGITRNNVLVLAGKQFDVEETTVHRSALRNAKEAFLTSTTKRIVPVVKVDDTTIGDGKPGVVTQTLLEGLIDLEEQDRRR